jgi:hypothetical protein
MDAGPWSPRNSSVAVNAARLANSRWRKWQRKTAGFPGGGIMGKFWCWLFGHKWRTVSDFVIAKTDFHDLFYCERCGVTGGRILREDGK